MLDKIGGMAYVNTLLDAVQTAASAEYYARVVKEKSTLRGLIAAGNNIAELGYAGLEALRIYCRVLSPCAGPGSRRAIVCTNVRS